MLTHNLGYPRIGAQRQLKKACEAYWADKISLEQLQEAGKVLRKDNWLLQRDAGIDLIPCNDFSLYDHVLDMTLALGAVPERYRQLVHTSGIQKSTSISQWQGATKERAWISSQWK